MRRQRRSTRSPLKQDPLRNPGQSIQDELDDLIFDQRLEPLILAVVAVVLAGLEWWRVHFSIPPSPWIFTIFAVVLTARAVRRLLRTRQQVRNLRQGRDGEKAVAQYLEEHKDTGWRLLSDVPGAGFNVDHVLVTPHGIFTIETKAVSKPERGQVVVDYDGTRVLVNGRELDRDPIIQTRAGRDWIRSILEESTSRRFSLRGVVVFPDWYVEIGPSARNASVWVLNQKMLPSFVRREPIVLSPDDVALVWSRLADHVRRWTD